jgi:hypothetical protein
MDWSGQHGSESPVIGEFEKEVAVIVLGSDILLRSLLELIDWEARDAQTDFWKEGVCYATVAMFEMAEELEGVGYGGYAVLDLYDDLHAGRDLRLCWLQGALLS